MPQSAPVATKARVAPSSDGRVRRRERSGRAIVAAMVALIREGRVAPTAQQVARRAGVGIRTVFRRFSDMEDLFAEMSLRVLAEAPDLLREGRFSGDIGTRARTLVERRAGFFEHIAPFKRAANLRRWRSPFLRSGHARLVEGLRADLVRSLPDAPADLLDILELLTSFEAWDRLRGEQHLDPERARAAVERAVLALLGVARVARPRRIG